MYNTKRNGKPGTQTDTGSDSLLTPEPCKMHSAAKTGGKKKKTLATNFHYQGKISFF